MWYFLLIRKRLKECVSLLLRAKVACRNSFGPMPKVETPYIVSKLPKRQNAETVETAETAETVSAFWHSFGITDTNTLLEFRHCFGIYSINFL